MDNTTINKFLSEQYLTKQWLKEYYYTLNFTIYYPLDFPLSHSKSKVPYSISVWPIEALYNTDQSIFSLLKVKPA